MRQLILDYALQPQHRQSGLKLTHPREDLLCLETSGGSPISYFDSKSATVQQIHGAANTWMEETDACIDPAVKFFYAEHPFYDKNVTMQNFLDYLCKEKIFMKCPKCGKEVRIRPYGDGYVVVCCGEVLYNSKKLPEATNAKS